MSTEDGRLRFDGRLERLGAWSGIASCVVVCPEIEGEDPVRQLIESFGTSLPGITYVATELHHADRAVIVEYRITGRHDGEYNGIAPTGSTVDYPAIAVYEFDGPDLICERMYLNLRGLEAQLPGVTSQPTA